MSAPDCSASGSVGAALPPRAAPRWSLRVLPPAGLEDETWARRHRALSLFAVSQGLLLVVFAFFIRGDAHMWLEALALAAASSLSLVTTLPRRARSCLTSVVLVATSALLVHVSGGHIEAHFHYFAMIALISLYEEWRPLALSVGFVLLEHAAVGVLDPHSLYGGAHDAGWQWAGVHAGAVLGMCVAVVVVWRLRQMENERAARRLQNAADFSQLLLARAHEPILALDTHGHVTYANRTVVALLERDPDQLLGRSLHAALHEGPGECDLDTCAIAAATSSAAPAGEDQGALVLELPGALRAELHREALVRSGVDLGTAVTFVLRDDARLEEQRRADELRDAIHAGELVLHYQPKVDLQRGRCVGAEALVRWQHPERGLLFPDAFLPLAERAGLLDDLTQWVVTEAIRQVAEWSRSGHRHKVAVNVPPSALLTDRLLELICAQLAAHRVSPYSIELEITETGIVDDLAAVVASLELARSLGITASLDDFGTGFSSLTHLVDLPVKALKVDRSFVMAMAHDDRADAVVTATLALAAQLGLKVVAEGVEDEAAATSLRDRGCSFGQGYHWSRPLPPQAFLDRVGEIEAASGPAPVAEGDRSLQPGNALLAVVHQAMSAIYTSPDAAGVQAAVVDAVLSLGGRVTSAEAGAEPGTTVFDVDCSLGTASEALLAAVPAGSLAAQRVETAVKLLLPEAQRALYRFTPARRAPSARRPFHDVEERALA